MNNSLNSVSTDSDKFIIGKLPTESRTVSIMTIGQLYKALGGNTKGYGYAWDTTTSYNYSTLCVYAINDTPGTNDALSNSIVENLRAVGLDWYKQLNRPFYRSSYWENAGSGTHSLFGGLLHSVCNRNGSYYLSWYYYDNSIAHSYVSDYWNAYVSGDAYVAVVRK